MKRLSILYAWAARLSAYVSANQCDGCRRGLPMENGIHHEADGHPYMMCERSKYEVREP